jgi:hypothetical protein
MRLLRGLFLFAFIFTCSSSYGQEDLFAQLDDSQEEVPFDLLPERMLFTQRLLWGEKGLMRLTGLSDLDEEHRMRELKLRKTMLNVHQVIGYATLAGMVAQGIIGGQLYNGDYSLYDTHETLGGIATATYFTGAALSLFAPPPLISSKEIGVSGARAHKWLGKCAPVGYDCHSVLQTARYCASPRFTLYGLSSLCEATVAYTTPTVMNIVYILVRSFYVRQ